MGALRSLQLACGCKLQATQSACLQRENKTAYVWGDGGLDLQFNATPRPCILQSHRVTTTPGFFGPSPATHLKASSPFSHMQAELPALLSFPGGSNHKPEFDERCLHRVTADVHTHTSLSGRTRPSQDKKTHRPRSRVQPHELVAHRQPSLPNRILQPVSCQGPRTK